MYTTPSFNNYQHSTILASSIPLLTPNRHSTITTFYSSFKVKFMDIKMLTCQLYSLCVIHMPVIKIQTFPRHRESSLLCLLSHSHAHAHPNSRQPIFLQVLPILELHMMETFSIYNSFPCF